MMKVTLFLLITLMAVMHSQALVSPAFVRQSVSRSKTSSSTSLQMTVLAYGTKKKNFKEGSALASACKQLGVPVKYSCKKGDCATCEISLGGRRIKTCQGKVPPEPKLKSLQEKGLEIRA